jgi:hypothetical protein
MTVFELRIFRENLTETFYLSVFGILALMFGALIINIMLNMTRIAEKHNQDNVEIKKSSKSVGLIFLLSFPLIFGLLFGGDYLTSKKKEKMLIASAKSIIESNTEKSDKLLNYSFTKEWIEQTDNILDIYSETDTYFPNVSVIVADTIDDSKVFLSIRSSYYYETEIIVVDENGNKEKTTKLNKKAYIFSTTKAEREYLNEIFYNNSNNIRFIAEKGNYKLFYPYRKGDKIIVFYFSDYQRYGKSGF